ncbi:OmpA family membrane associated protein [Propionibacterium freudenreichii]|nr:OmpA family membrane associated protein [Propionibacterium freudenreichii]
MVLGAGVRGQRPTPYLAARLDLAVRLWREGAISRILVSGWAEAPGDAAGVRYDEPAVMADYLVAHGVARGAVLRDPAGLDTWTSAVRARRLHGLDAMVVVTQAYHLPRALAAARMAGIDALGVADTTRDHNAKWWRYRLREVPACVKLVGEWALSRTGLRDAARARRGDQ